LSLRSICGNGRRSNTHTHVHTTCTHNMYTQEQHVHTHRNNMYTHTGTTCVHTHTHTHTQEQHVHTHTETTCTQTDRQTDRRRFIGSTTQSTLPCSHAQPKPAYYRSVVVGCSQVVSSWRSGRLQLASGQEEALWRGLAAPRECQAPGVHVSARSASVFRCSSSPSLRLTLGVLPVSTLLKGTCCRCYLDV
jgi:hypothetical protein